MSKKSKEERKKRLKTTPEQALEKFKTTQTSDAKIHFRFDFFDAYHTFFNGSVADFDWARGLILRLSELQDLTVSFFKTNVRFKKLQYVHPITWEKTRLDSFGIDHQSPDLDEDAWQFGLSKTNGRVHGFFINNFFYVVWIDPEHRLYEWQKPN